MAVRPFRLVRPVRPRAPRTLRGRLIAVLTVVLAAGFTVAAVATIVLVRTVLIDRLDDQLISAGDRFAVSLERSGYGTGDGTTDSTDTDSTDTDSTGSATYHHHDGTVGAGERYEETTGQAVGTLGARIADGVVTDAAVIGDDETSADIPAAALKRLAEFTEPTEPLTLDLPGLGDYRLVVTAGRDDDLQVTGLPADDLEHVLHRLAAIVVGVFAVCLLLLVLGSTLIVRFMLAPLARIAQTARHVAGLSLDSGGGAVPYRVTATGGGSEVDTVARAFNAMLEEVEAALRTRAAGEQRLRRFIADASHELRTPITVVRSHAELARREGGDQLPEAVERSLARIRAQSERMGHLVEDLLLLARLDSGRALAEEPVDIVRLALDAVEDARAAAAGHHWRLGLPTLPVTVTGDPQALAQVLANLLTNVAAHTPAGTTATLTVDRTGDRVTVRVADDGPGLPADLAERAFDRFVRGESPRDSAHGSSGLGLAIVAAIVTAHHGSTDLSSAGTGTTVTLDLPAAAQPPE